MVSQFVEKQVKVFKGAYPTPLPFKRDAIEGESPQTWFRPVQSYAHELTCSTLEATINRARLLELAADEKTSIDDLCVSILAWGGMRPANRKRLFERSARPWLDVAEAVRAGGFSRSSAYLQFANLRSRKDKLMNGMGPAYFTKLIYFLTQRNQSKGYILDQWAGLSINLVSGRNLVKMDENISWKFKGKALERVVSSRVSDVNTEADYERFCTAIESFSDHLGAGWTPDQAELALMSGGSDKWRQHVVAERHGSLPVLTTTFDA